MNRNQREANEKEAGILGTFLGTDLKTVIPEIRNKLQVISGNAELIHSGNQVALREAAQGPTLSAVVGDDGTFSLGYAVMDKGGITWKKFEPPAERQAKAILDAVARIVELLEACDV